MFRCIFQPFQRILKEKRDWRFYLLLKSALSNFPNWFKNGGGRNFRIILKFTMLKYQNNLDVTIGTTKWKLTGLWIKNKKLRPFFQFSCFSLLKNRRSLRITAHFKGFLIVSHFSYCISFCKRKKWVLKPVLLMNYSRYKKKIKLVFKIHISVLKLKNSHRIYKSNRLLCNVLINAIICRYNFYKFY